MTAIGGFLGLESPRAGSGAYHTVPALTTGRACLRFILEAVRPRTMYLPFYVCDALLIPLRSTRTQIHFYALGPDLEPSLDLAQIEPDELFLYVNYFGLHDAGAERAAAKLGPNAVIDDSQAFFRRGRSSTWSFNSARKFLGVPDGAYLYGPGAPLLGDAVSPVPDASHLWLRAAGEWEAAYRRFQTFEAQLDDGVRAMSDLSARLLKAADYKLIARRRRQNFNTLHELLGALNGLHLEPIRQSVPLYYPFLSSATLRDRLIECNVYVPCLWPEVVSRAGDEFAWERVLASRLCPLPIDQRYTARVMRVVAREVVKALV